MIKFVKITEIFRAIYITTACTFSINVNIIRLTL